MALFCCQMYKADSGLGEWMVNLRKATLMNKLVFVSIWSSLWIRNICCSVNVRAKADQTSLWPLYKVYANMAQRRPLGYIVHLVYFSGSETGTVD